MPIYVKELIIVLGLSIPLFAVAKPTALLFMDEGDFTRRRKVWLLLTSVAFLSPSFWIFAAVAAPVLYSQGRKDTNPIGFYLLLLTVAPAVSVEIPVVGINELFPLDIFRLLSFCVLLPAALRIRSSNDAGPLKGMKIMDIALLGLGALQAVLFVPPYLPNHPIFQNSLTNDIRQAFLFLVDVYALYYVTSRSCSDLGKLRDALAAFCLSCFQMAVTAIFESVKHWLLYPDIVARWGGNSLATEYFVRGAFLRAQASAGQPLGLAFLLVIGFGFWLYLQSHVKSTAVKVTGTALLCAGLLVTFSRGPWLAAVLVYLAYAALGPRGAPKLLKAAVAVLLFGGALLATPFGDKISAMLPFMGGNVADSSLTYREQLAERSWQLIQAQPFFGDQMALWKMQDLVQGQGIIDVVNAYVGVTLFNGFTGLTLFLTFILSSLLKAFRASKRMAKTDPDAALLGTGLSAAIVAILLLLADGSLGSSCERLFYTLIGLAGAYAALSQRQNLVTTEQRAIRDSRAAVQQVTD